MRAFIAFLFLVLFTAGAAAQSCSALKSQLASAQAGQPNQAVVASLNKRARSFGCILSQSVGQSQQCRSIAAQLRQAKAGGVNRGRVRRIRNQIATHCGGGGTQQARSKGPRQETKGARRKNIFSAIFGRRDRSEEEFQQASVDSQRGSRKVERVDLDAARKVSRSASGAKSGGSAPLATRAAQRSKGSSREGSSRTMCVRLCDGFYFPINSRSHSDNYYDELAMCVGRCPGADVSLYVHHNGGAVEQMRSAMTGEAYVNLPTAFDYRKELKPGCGCSNGTRIVRGNEKPPAMSYASAAPAGNTATDAAGGKDNSRWTPYRATYDGTGEALTISRTAYGSMPSTAVTVRSPTTGKGPALPLRPVPIVTKAPESDIATVEFDPANDGVREVGPQFFSEAVAEFSASKERSIQNRRNPEPATVITVTPLPPSLRTDVPNPDAEEQQADHMNDEDVPPNTSAMVPPAPYGG